MLKKILAVLTLCLLITGICVPLAVAAAPSADLLADEAGVLSDEEEAELSRMLSEASAKYNTDIIAVTVNGKDGYGSLAECADWYILNNDYGQGAEKDAILFMIDVTGREWHFSTHGQTIYAFTDGTIELLGEEVLPYLKNLDWAGAIKEYCEDASGYIDYKNVNGVAYGQAEEKKKDPLMPGLIGVVAGILGSLGITKGMKSQLETVQPKTTAAGYFDPGKLKIQRHSDTFLYANVTRIPIRTENKGGGGGFSTHSTGGSSFGGGGGKF